MIKSTGPISTPTFQSEDEEDVIANGFAWSNKYGIMHQTSAFETIVPQGATQWLGTHS